MKGKVWRLAEFNLLKVHDLLGKVFSRLTDEDREFCRKFLLENRHLDKGEFERKVNVMFLDREKPKNAAAIQELLSCANSMVEK